jgi:hypothetical protein
LGRLPVGFSSKKLRLINCQPYGAAPLKHERKMTKVHHSSMLPRDEVFIASYRKPFDSTPRPERDLEL